MVSHERISGFLTYISARNFDDFAHEISITHAEIFENDRVFHTAFIGDLDHKAKEKDNYIR